MARNNDFILIAVIGVTGAGKSTFINKATGKNECAVGHSIISCTADVSCVPTTVDGRRVVLIDTPGFDDTNRTDADILEDIAEFLGQTYHEGMLLTGIILLHPITGNKAFGSELSRTRLFKKICGENAYSHVVIATTMWDELSDSSHGEARVFERKSSGDFWGDMLDHGAKVVTHKNNTESAHDIIRMLLKKKKTTLKMQKELHENNGDLSATSAAQQARDDIGARSEKENRKLEEVLRELQQSRQSNADLQAELRQLKEFVNDLQQQRTKLENTTLEYSRSGTGPEWVTALAALGTAATGAAATAVLALPFISCAVM